MGIKGLFGIDIISGVIQYGAMIPYFTLFYAEVPIYFDRDCTYTTGESDGYIFRHFVGKSPFDIDHIWPVFYSQHNFRG